MIWLSNKKKYVIYINNFFTSLKLFSTFRDYDIKAAGIIQISKTKREKNKKNKEK